MPMIAIIAYLWSGERPQLLDVDVRAEELLLVFVEIPHANLTKVTRVAERQTDAAMSEKLAHIKAHTCQQGAAHDGK